MPSKRQKGAGKGAGKKGHWHSLDTFPDYEVSRHGEVRRIVEAKTRHIGHKPKGFLQKGYKYYKLVDFRKKKITIGAHVLVCLVWHGPKPSPKHQVAHWDGKPQNIYYTNLRWATSKENHADRKRHQTDAVGSRNGRAVVSEIIVKRIRAQFKGRHGDITRLARQYGLSHSAMGSICHKEHWKHV